MTSLVKRNGTLGLFPELPSMFDDPFLRNWFNWSNTNQDTGTLPAVNIRETNETYDITVAAPGMTKNDFKRSYNGKESNIDIEKYQNNRFYFDESIKLSFSKIKEVLKPFRRHEDGVEGIIYRTL